MFNVLKHLNLTEAYGDINTTHFRDERTNREDVSEMIGAGNIILSALVDTNHPNGLEVHQLTDTGIIYIYNQNSRRLVTKLIARPGQVRRYYEPFNLSFPEDVIKLAREHQKNNLNNS